ncbi:MAG: TonB-dependent receptor [Bryobacteraceae bacterium]|nr:TonB-dependent receptor [Bryobacteraceae bacterium]
MRKVTFSLLALLVSALAPAQEFRATISGHVYDASGAAVPNAKIEAVNLENSETTNATSDTGGNYTLPFLRPGNYKMVVTAPGFKTYNRENLVLEVGRLIGIDVSLEVGQLSESVSVTAEAALLETQTGSRVGVVNTIQVSELPLNSRNPFMLGSMMSGVTFRGAAIWQRPFDNGAIAEWSVNGGRQSNNEFLMDGAPNNAQMGNNNIAYVPIVDAVQEFSVQQNSYDAGYGKTGGGVFNVVLKSGSNEHHVTLWEFYRRRWLDANTYQNNSVGLAKPAHELDQYGWQFAGPVRIPKILRKDGPVKLFYLGAYEGYREVWPQFLRNSYAAPEMRTGDFSRLRNPSGEPIIIYDPVTTQFAANGDPIRTPFPGNVIPQNRIHPVARAVTGFMPAPNATTAGVRYAQQNVLNPDYSATDKFYNLILKFDWNFGDNHRMFMRHASNDRTEDRCVNGICAGPGTDGQQPFQRINDAYVLDYLWTINPSTILNIRASNNRFVEKGFGAANDGFDLTSLGLSPALVNQLPAPRYFGRWNFYDAATGTTNQYSPLGRYQGVNITNSYNLFANLTKIIGSHTIKLGYDLRRTHYLLQNTGDILRLDARPNWTQRLWNQAEPNSGDAFASFLLGGVDGSVNYPVFPFFRNWYSAPFVQDDWKVSRKLTLNLGLRWDLNFYPDEKYNRVNRGFNAQEASPIANQVPAAMLAMYPQLRSLTGNLQFAGVNGNPTETGKRDWNNFQPRIGAAYQLNDKTVIRGGYGLYYLNPNNNWQEVTGFQNNTPVINSQDGGRTLIPNLLTNPFPSGINTPVGSTLGGSTFVGQNFNWFNGNMSIPRFHSFSFGIQRQLGQSSTIELSYVGSRTRGANTERDFNIPSVDFRRRCNLQEGGSPNFCNELIPNPFQGVAAFRGTEFFTRDTLSRFQLARPFPQFNGNLQERGRGESSLNYNSLQVNYNVRAGRGLTLIANYTFSKTIERFGYNDPYNNVMQQGLYFNDRPHFVKFSTVYELPIGRGKKFGSGINKWTNGLIGGWQVSTFSQIASGEPNDLPNNVIQLRDPRTKGGDFTGDFGWKDHQVKGFNPCVLRQFNDGSIRPQQFSLDRGCGTDTANYAWLRTADYAPRYTPFRSGQIRKQSLFNMDVALSKTVEFTDRIRAQFRLEAFNATNYYFYGRNDGFNTNPDSPLFGTVFPNQGNTQNGYPRQFQLGIKLFF